MNSRFLVVLSSLVLLSPAFALSVSAGEDPYNRDCDGFLVVIVLCAGADAGTNGDCDNDENQSPFVSCWYTYGWNVNASSPAQLPGGGRLTWAFDVEYCIDGAECTVLEAGGGVLECSWTLNGVQHCLENSMGAGSVDVTLALGECIVVTATVTVSAEAWSLTEEAPIFSAQVADDSEGGGAACYLDNGRN